MINYRNITDTERVVEIPWLVEKLGNPTLLLDIGSASALYLHEFDRIHAVHLVDTRPIPVTNNSFKRHRMDASYMPWLEFFDVVTCISVLDHVGLESYDMEPDPDALPRLMGALHRVLSVNGRLLVTVPVGIPQITQHPNGEQRVFSPAEFKGLFKTGWKIVSENYWRLAAPNYYRTCNIDDVKTCNYAGHRAEAVCALEVKKHANI